MRVYNVFMYCSHYSILESAVEDIRRDVVDRRCRVHEREVDGLIDAVTNTSYALSQAKG